MLEGTEDSTNAKKLSAAFLSGPGRCQILATQYAPFLVPPAALTRQTVACAMRSEVITVDSFRITGTTRPIPIRQLRMTLSGTVFNHARWILAGPYCIGLILCMPHIPIALQQSAGCGSYCFGPWEGTGSWLHLDC
jgi:hypothetical protein